MRSRARARTLGLVALGLSGALALAGCSGDEPDRDGGDGGGATSAVDATGGTAAPDDGEDTAAAPVEPPTAPADIRPIGGERSASGSTDVTVDGEHAGFVTPSGNIACSVTAESAVCQVSDKSFTVDADHLSDQNLPGCDASDADAIRLVTGRGAWTCAPEPLTGQAEVSTGGWWVEDVDGTTLDLGGATLAVLPYGSSLTVGSVTCSSEEAGVTCQAPDLGEEFFVARTSYSYS